jgi:phosphoserine aminotransferase
MAPGSLFTMSERVVNFAPGPAMLPLTVLEQVRSDLVSLPGLGISPLEISHRSAWFGDVIEEAEGNLRGLLELPASHHVVFCQGGATQQFSMAPMNLLRGSRGTAEYVVTGSWGAKAVREAEKEGSVRVAWSGADEGSRRVPEPHEWSVSPDAAYLHVTTNETIEGVQWPVMPFPPPGVPIVADASSDFLSRPIDVAPIGLLYAGAQKNLGPAGVTVVIVRDDLLERAPAGLPAMLDYRTFVENDSLYNTPPVFAIYVLMLVTRWLRAQVEDLVEQERRATAKAALLYDAIDDSDGFYAGHADPGSRSIVNVTFRSPGDELDARFVAQAAERGLAGLKGHRSVGGVRASIYNAMPIEGVEALAGFMATFASSH